MSSPGCFDVAALILSLLQYIYIYSMDQDNEKVDPTKKKDGSNGNKLHIHTYEYMCDEKQIVVDIRSHISMYMGLRGTAVSIYIYIWVSVK